MKLCQKSGFMDMVKLLSDGIVKIQTYLKKIPIVVILKNIVHNNLGALAEEVHGECRAQLGVVPH